jgi:hypothetical protein
MVGAVFFTGSPMVVPVLILVLVLVILADCVTPTFLFIACHVY